MSQKLETNAAGRQVVTEINGQTAVPFKGVGKYVPKSRKHAPLIVSCSDFPSDGNKLIGSIKEALKKL